MTEQPASTPGSRRGVESVVQSGPVHASAYVCEAVSCLSTGSDEILTGLGTRIADTMMTDVAVKRVGCLGLCAAGPLVQIPETGELFRQVRPDALEPIVDALEAVTPSSGRVTEAAFFDRQVRIATEHFGRIDPESLDDYVGIGGYTALGRALTTMTTAEVRDEITKSGLRGRGGAGYPAGLKWNTVAKAIGSGKYVICNADEGDPGAFMDRTILESDPHRVLEGMAIAAYAVGASAGYVYCRGEYPLVVSRVRKAIRDATLGGYLGNTIMDTKFSFEVDVRLGAGAYVCGEETALIASIEGKRGTPVPRPPVSSRRRPMGPPDTHQQRRDPGQRRTHHPQRRRLVRLDRDSDQQGHEGLRPRRPGGQHRDRGSPDGHNAAGDRVRHRWRDRRWRGLQGGPDRRPGGWLHPRPVP